MKPDKRQGGGFGRPSPPRKDEPMKELNRVLRHLLAPVVAYAVAEGYLPEYMQGDVTEALVLLAAIGIPMALSWYRDRVK